MYKVKLSGSSNQTIKIWILSTGQEVRTLTTEAIYVECVALSADGQTLVSGSNDMMIKVWNLSTGKEVCTFTGFRNSIDCVPTFRSLMRAFSEYSNSPKER